MRHGLLLLNTTHLRMLEGWRETEHLPLLPHFEETVCRGQATGLWYHDTFLGCGGYKATDYPGTFHVWLIPALAVLQHPRFAVWGMRRWLRAFVQRGDVRRVQTLAKADWPEANRLLLLLGLRWEGTMQELRPGVSYHMYGAVVK